MEKFFFFIFVFQSSFFIWYHYRMALLFCFMIHDPTKVQAILQVCLLPSFLYTSKTFLNKSFLLPTPPHTQNSLISFFPFFFLLIGKEIKKKQEKLKKHSAFFLCFVREGNSKDFTSLGTQKAEKPRRKKNLQNNNKERKTETKKVRTQKKNERFESHSKIDKIFLSSNFPTHFYHLFYFSLYSTAQ